MSYVSDRPSTAPRSTADCPPGEPETQFDARNPLTHSVEGSADALMDDVFADIERMVERGVGMYAPDDDDDEAIFERIKSIDRSRETAQPNESEELDIFSQKALEPEPSDALAVLPKVSPRELTMGEAEIDADVLLNLAKEDQPSRESSRSFDALLVSIIVATLAITGGLWFYLRHRTPAAITPTVEAPTPAETLKTQQEKEFLAYVQRSLERIDRSRKQADAVANANTSTTPTVLERIYVPIYQPPSVTGLPGASPTAPLPNPSITTVPIPSTAPPVAAVPAPSAAPAPSPSVAAIPNIAPAPSHVLIGLLELGDRSAALFEIEGTPHRVQMGERIGASGWTLVSISNQEAIVRRNGEVRSIYIGQQF
ncbi:hypothetical protein C7B61_04505 [filamentous cyanobacterium CCP1]|nr:hypothetical protein C7B76_18500 [filamentous cyanobacterium CCP2]PSB67752.1 hypothetical protein C7B61_04505 [filamentous cyanobacterium CCP1]